MQDDEENQNIYSLNAPIDGSLNALIHNEENEEKYFLLCNSEEKSVTFAACLDIESFLKCFTAEITKLRLNRSKTNIVYHQISLLLSNTSTFTKKLITDNNGMDNLQSVEKSFKHVSEKLSEFTTTYKRNKYFKKNEMYVEPREIAIGLRWDLVREHRTLTTVSKLVQNKFVYVSMIETLSSLFKRQDFREAFFQRHKLVADAYSSFRSGKTFRSNELFQSNENSIQIQIAVDDFEICNPLGSRSTLHKITAFYFCVRNVPQKYLSKLNNIYLLAACNTDDTKTLYTDINDVLRPIVKEIKFLEEFGINIDPETNLKGTVVNMSYDNLGGQICLSLVESFRTSSSYCRVCECVQAECKKLCVEDETKIRNRDKYQQQLNVISCSSKVDFMETLGVKRYCVLNDLKYFNIFDNISVDIMHDLNEGVIPFLMKQLFKLCLSSKIITLEGLNGKIKNFDFGVLNRGHVPSSIILEKHSLNQNASQSKCLFESLPFILFDEQNDAHLKKVWDCIESLLIIVQIAYSMVIKKTDVEVLREKVRIHLDLVQRLFKIDLIPKHHLLLHYARVIEHMGSLVPMSMIRFEAKHKDLKQISRNSINFINPTKSLSVMHQQNISVCTETYKDSIEHGISSNVPGEFFDMYDFDKPLRQSIFEIKWLKLNDWTYRPGLFIIDSGVLCEIINIFQCVTDFIFLVRDFECSKYFTNLNSLKIQLKFPYNCRALYLKTLKNAQVYEKKVYNGEFYIIVDTLDTKYSIDFDF